MPTTKSNSTNILPKFITFEGGEGAGKSTQAKLLVEAFKRNDQEIAITREPGGTDGAEAIRNLLVNGDSDKWEPETELLLHLAARSDHINKFIKPALTSGKHVICDRFTDSSIAYQAYGHGLGRNYVEALCNLVVGNFIPDLTIILDIPLNTGMNRTEIRGMNENRYEKMGTNFHERVREGFQQTARLYPQRCVVINAENDIDSVHKQIISTLDKHLHIKL